MSGKKIKIIIASISLIGLVGIWACDSSGTPSGTQTVNAGGSGSSQAVYEPQATVCDPFTTQTSGDDSNPSTDSYHGIVAQLKYLPDSAPRYTSVLDYQKYGTPVNETLFFNNINVPTRLYNQAFTTESGTVLTNQDGNMLLEYFSLHFDTQLTLSSGDSLGQYQLAVISDDGSIVSVDQGSGMSTLINNDNVQPSTFRAATTPITFTSSAQAIPMSIDYFQGPRYHIALVLLWREFPSDPSLVVPALQGVSGNSKFFNPNVVPSAPEPAYTQLLSQGWKVITSSHFLLPSSVAQNPCQSTAPVTTQITTTNPSNSITNQTSMQIGFQSNTAGASFQCQLDSSSLSSCTPPMTYSNLTNATHLFSVFASANGQTDSKGASYQWTVNTIAPTISGPITVTPTSNSFTVSWTTSEATTAQLHWGTPGQITNVIPETSTFFQTNTVPVSNLSPGTVYNFYVSGHDQAGNAYTSGVNVTRTTF